MTWRPTAGDSIVKSSSPIPQALLRLSRGPAQRSWQSRSGRGESRATDAAEVVAAGGGAGVKVSLHCTTEQNWGGQYDDPPSPAPQHLTEWVVGYVVAIRQTSAPGDAPVENCMPVKWDLDWKGWWGELLR